MKSFVSRRKFLKLLSAGGMIPLIDNCSPVSSHALYQARAFGNLTLMHFTDCHGQLLPVYYREPAARLKANVAEESALTGQEFLKFYGISPHSRQAYAFTDLNFVEAAREYGKMGGFAHLATLVRLIKEASPHGNVLLLDGGDTWQGSATALWTQGADMVDACNKLGVDVMTGHWEFTYGSQAVMVAVSQFKGDFVAQNISVSEEAQFESASTTEIVFKPYVIKENNGIRAAVIGQAYPYTPIANPKRFMPDWQFGIQEQGLQKIVDGIRQRKEADVLILLSHNGLAIDLKLASRITGLDVILGGHTHDALPNPLWVENPAGRTCVTNAGSHGKFLAVLDMVVKNGRMQDLRYRLLPVFSNMLPADAEMAALIDRLRQPYLERLNKTVGIADRLLYRRDTFKGTFDELILQALLKVSDAQIAFSPGFRWGTALLPGQPITYEDVMGHCAITYPQVLTRNLTGLEIKAILEDAADNVFNPDPYYQQGGDMVRAGGITFKCDPAAGFGQRIGSIRLANGEPLQAEKRYRSVSWAAVGTVATGAPIDQVVVDYLKTLD